MCSRCISSISSQTQACRCRGAIGKMGFPVRTRDGVGRKMRPKILLLSCAVSLAAAAGPSVSAARGEAPPPSISLPESVDSALAVALDTLGLTPLQMNFDRNWSPSVVLPDSTVILCLQDIFAMPSVLSEAVGETSALLRSPSATLRSDTRALGDLVSLVSERDSAYRAAASSLPPSELDVLAGIAAQLWADPDNPGEWGAWGGFHESRGMTSPPEFEGDPDSLALWLSKWPVVERIDPGVLIALACALRELEWHDPSDLGVSGVEGSVCALDTDAGYIVGGPGDNVYGPGAAFRIIVDVGGNDDYEGVGGAFGPSGEFAVLIVDLSGDDSYRSDVPVAAGAGFMGFGALVDLEGNDLYDCGPVSLGAGLFGEGILIDLAGDDSYTADFFSEGAGCLGTGILLDASGADTYRTACYGQGFGGPAGVGSLVDGGGSDCYLAGFVYSHAPLLPHDNRAMSQGFGMGFRPLVAGGRGLLADFGDGNDTYRAEVFGQGGAYFYGLGMLFDEAGQDCYSAAQYAQGSGVHLAAGCLWDGAGDDSYLSRYGPSQGAAHDLSTGLLYDGGGDDIFVSDGAQGFAINNSAALLVDIKGSDLFVCGEGHGVGAWSRGSAGCGVFIDMADDDVFLGGGADSVRWTDGAWGAGLDVASVTPEVPVPPEEIGNPEDLEMDSLFSVAAEWEVGENRDRVMAHRDELASRGREALEYIAEEQLNTTDGLALRAMLAVFRKNQDVAVPMFTAMLDSLSGRRLRNTVHLLGETGGEEARLPLEALLSSDTLSVRLSAMQALGGIGNPESLSRVIAFASDSSARMRRQVAVTLAGLGDTAAIPVLEEMAADWFLDVRSAALKALEMLRPEEDDLSVKGSVD